jgi:hypothetical protein
MQLVFTEWLTVVRAGISQGKTKQLWFDNLYACDACSILVLELLSIFLMFICNSFLR